MLNAIREGLTEAWTSVAAFTPKLVAALVILLVGVIIAKIVKNVAVKFLDRVKFDDVLAKAGVRAAGETTGYDPKQLVAGVVYWILLFVTFQLAAETLGAVVLATMLAGLISFLPLVLVAVAIITIAMAFAAWVRGAIEANVGERGRVGGRIAYWAIVTFGAFAALNQLNLAEEIVNAVFYAIVGAVAVSATIAFGVGGIPVARQLTAKWTHKVDKDITVRAA